ncbi:MAG TPA: hypothetical protein VFX80_03030 [Solirubrobacteraceae bacterium]|nr:hypothetical protein [Solirubrobacteraceae bacterium]
MDSITYEQLRADGDLEAVRAKWETPVLLIGDFNDEPSDTSVVDHLQASSELERVTGPTNDIDGFRAQTADYRETDAFLYNPCWRFLAPENLGSFFISSTPAGEVFANRYQVLDQLVVSRGLLKPSGLRLDLDSVDLWRAPSVATPSGRPRRFDRKTGKGTSDHLPLVATLTY